MTCKSQTVLVAVAATAVAVWDTDVAVAPTFGVAVAVAVGAAVSVSATDVALACAVAVWSSVAYTADPGEEATNAPTTRASPATAATAHNQDPFHLSILSLLLN
ncbi:MAG: hypothetical protein ABSC13_00800 [Dehalococcoidia bacterium]